MSAEAIERHAEEMYAHTELHLPGGVILRAGARATPAGVVAAAIFCSAIILSIVPLVSAARRRMT